MQIRERLLISTAHTLKHTAYFLSGCVGAQEQISYWPEDERRRCPAIIERGSGSRPEGGGDVADASILCSATGIPVAELSRFGIPFSDSALAKLYPSKYPSFLLFGSEF